MTMLVRFQRGGRAHHALLHGDDLTTEERFGLKQGTVRVLLKNIPADIAALPLSKLLWAYARAVGEWQAARQGRTA